MTHGGCAPARGPAELWWAYWPRLGYSRGLSLQHMLRRARLEDRIPDVLIVAEHTATVTLGRRANLADLPLGPAALAPLGVALYTVRRGGRATYHGPGQIVAYPIVDLRRLGLGIRRFVERLLNAASNALGEFGVAASAAGPMPGLWLGNQKIASLGLEVRDGISSHGIAVNVAVDETGFSLIVPCGVATLATTSISSVSKQPPDLLRVGESLAQNLGAILGLYPRHLTASTLERRAGAATDERLGGSVMT